MAYTYTRTDQYIEYTTPILQKKKWVDILPFQDWLRVEKEKEEKEEKEKEEKAEAIRKREENAAWSCNLWLRISLLREEPFTEEVYQTMERLFGSPSPSDMGFILGRMTPPAPLPTVMWLVERGVMVDWNTSRAPMPILFHVASAKEDAVVGNVIAYMRYLLQQGADPNGGCGSMIPPCPFLIYYLTHHLALQGISLPYPVLMERLECLLEAGADPLLEDRGGKNAMDVVRGAHRFTNIPADVLRAIQMLLERYT